MNKSKAVLSPTKRRFNPKKNLIPGKAVGQNYSLPSEPNKVSDDFDDDIWMIYGPKKIGKTSLAAQFPDAFFLMFEKEAKKLPVYQRFCDSWEAAEAYVALLKEQKKKGSLQFKKIVIDGALEAYMKCQEKVCGDLGIEYPREDNFGKDWHAVATKYRALHNEILSLGLGVVILCHEKSKENQTRAGDKFDSIGPDLPSGAEKYYKALVDNVVWYHFRDKQRFLLIRGSDYAFAGVAAAVSDKFVSKNGKPVYAIPMAGHPAQAYKNIQKAYNNEQLKSYEKETELFQEEKIKMSVKDHIKKEAKSARRKY